MDEGDGDTFGGEVEGEAHEWGDVALVWHRDHDSVRLPLLLHHFFSTYLYSDNWSLFVDFLWICGFFGSRSHQVKVVDELLLEFCFSFFSFFR